MDLVTPAVKVVLSRIGSRFSIAEGCSTNSVSSTGDELAALDVILLEIEMPGKDEYEFLAHLMKHEVH